jgi:hypothetical protein
MAHPAPGNDGEWNGRLAADLGRNRSAVRKASYGQDFSPNEAMTLDILSVR